jgi:hypothetical protein
LRSSLEDYDEVTGRAEKAAIMTHDVVGRTPRWHHIERNRWVPPDGGILEGNATAHSTTDQRLQLKFDFQPFRAFMMPPTTYGHAAVSGPASCTCCPLHRSTSPEQVWSDVRMRQDVGSPQE